MLNEVGMGGFGDPLNLVWSDPASIAFVVEPTSVIRAPVKPQSIFSMANATVKFATTDQVVLAAYIAASCG